MISFHYRHKFLEKVTDFCRTIQAVLGDRMTAVLSHDNPDPLVFESLKGIFIGNIIADVDGKDIGSVQVERFQKPQQGLSFVPIQVGLDFKDLLSSGLPEIWKFGHYLIDDLFDFGFLSRGYFPEMNGERKFFALDMRSCDSLNLCPHSMLRFFELGQKIQVGS